MNRNMFRGTDQGKFLGDLLLVGGLALYFTASLGWNIGRLMFFLIFRR